MDHGSAPALRADARPGVLVWFEDGPGGRRALAQASVIARRRSAPLTVLAVAPHERVIGCGRCLQGTVVWNVEMKKIAVEDLIEARRLLGDPDYVTYELVVGAPVPAIVGAAERLGIGTVVLPPLSTGRLGPPQRRNVRDRVAAAGRWQVIVGSLTDSA